MSPTGRGRRVRVPPLHDFQRTARAVLPRVGLELIGEGTGWRHARDYRVARRRLSEPLSPSGSDPYVTPFDIPLARIVSRVGFSHAPDGWHPFVETLREYRANPTLTYEQSTLARLYERYRPANCQEVLLDHVDEPLPPFSHWPPVVNLFRWVWAHNRHSVQRILRESRAGGPDRAWTHFGPHTQEYGRRELARLVGAYRAIEAEGYDDERPESTAVDGYFVTRGGRWRFVLLHGNHRVAALNALGYVDVRARIRRFHPPVIAHDELDRWTTRHGGLYSREATELLFEMLFTETGTAKARRQGLLEL